MRDPKRVNGWQGTERPTMAACRVHLEIVLLYGEAAFVSRWQADPLLQIPEERKTALWTKDGIITDFDGGHLNGSPV